MLALLFYYFPTVLATATISTIISIISFPLFIKFLSYIFITFLSYMSLTMMEKTTSPQSKSAPLYITADESLFNLKQPHQGNNNSCG